MSSEFRVRSSKLQTSNFKLQTGFTLIELLMAISLSVIIMGAVYFSLVSALESWRYTRDELALQKVVGQCLEEIVEGTDWTPGIRSSLEVYRAWDTQVGYVLPWTEEHDVVEGRGSYQLKQYVQFGSGLPTAELKVAEGEEFRPIPVKWDDPDNLTERPRLRPGFDLVSGSTLRFSYHPDPERVPESLVTIRWDPEDQALLREYDGGVEPIGKNPFGVVIADCRFRYYDPVNNLLTEYGDLSERELPLLTAVEVELTGRLRERTLTLIGMAMLRNSPHHSGLLILREGLRVPVPDSRAIKTLVLTNFMGITHEDELQLEIKPRVGRIYRVTLRFERYGSARPFLAQVTAEYPPGNSLLTDRPKTSADTGVDLLLLGSNGLYDYDDDPDLEDAVIVEGDPVTLTVTKMDMKGAGCFVQP